MDTFVPQVEPMVSAPGALPSAGALLSQALELYKQRFWTLLGVYFLPILLIIGILFFGIGGLFGLLLVGSKAGGAAPLVGLVLGLLVALLMVYIGVWGQGALLFAIKDSAENIGVVEAYKRASHKVLSLFWTSLLAGLAVGFGFFLFIIPGIIFMVWLAFSTYIVVAEDLSGSAALSRSRGDTKGRWGGVFGRLVVVIVLAIGLSLVISILSAILKSPAVGSILNLIASLLLTPYLTIYLFKLYEAVKQS